MKARARSARLARMLLCACMCFPALCRSEAATDGTPPDTSERDLFQAGWTTDSTTDDFERREWLLTYRNHRRDFVWPWEESTAKGLDWGIDLRRPSGSLGGRRFEGDRLFAMLGKLAPPAYLAAWLGSDHLRTAGRDRRILIYDATLRLVASDALTVRLESSRDFAYRDLFLPGGVTDLLVLTQHRLNVAWRPLQRLRILSNADLRLLDDDNRGTHFEGSVLYGISPGSPWLWVGVGGEWLGYREHRPNYWSPGSYHSAGLRIDSSFPLARWLEVDVSANLDDEKEDRLKSDIEEYVDAGLLVRLTPTLDLHLTAQHLGSHQTGRPWQETTYLLSIAGAL